MGHKYIEHSLMNKLRKLKQMHKKEKQRERMKENREDNCGERER
jgi:hypothetical protein